MNLEKDTLQELGKFTSDDLRYLKKEIRRNFKKNDILLKEGKIWY